MATWLALAVFIGVYVLLVTERVHRVAAALGGAVIVLASGVVTTRDAFYSEKTGVAWDVLALLLGMMVIVGILRQTGIFEYLAIWAVKRSRGNRFRVLVLLLVFTAVASAFLDNVTTVVLLAPVTLLVCDRMGMLPAPVLVAEVLASNIGGAATLIGDPPNIIIASRSGLTFNDFLVHMLPIVVVVFVVFLVASRWLFRHSLGGGSEASVADVMALDEREAITDASLLWRSLLVLAMVLTGFVLHGVIHTEPAIVALSGAGLLVLISRARPQTYLDSVEWETLAFFAGIFVLVGALVKTGVIDRLAQHVAAATGGNVAVSLVVMLVASAVTSAFVDNIPYVAAMTPVVSSLIAANPALGQDGALWWALALGGDLGGNGTAVGASANIVVIGLARQYGHPISFGQFARYGVPVAVGSVALCVPYLLLRYA